MGKFAKFLAGCTVAGAAAAGMYYYLEKSIAEGKLSEDDPTVRTYTTIKNTAYDTIGKVKEKIGPKGEGVLNVAQETAGKMKDVITDSAGKMKDILESREEEKDLYEPETEQMTEPAVEQGVESLFDDTETT